MVEITAAMEELARTASQIADNASSQADLAQAAEESGNAGQGAVEEAVDGVEEVKKRISGIASRAEILGTRSKEIYRVLDLITEIAQETHILSLNAAIEAAAAGDHGRRFSVVAEEVRRLAQRSQESVESVRNLLDEFAGSIRTTVVATEEGSKEAGRVLERARAAAAAIEDLRGASSDTARVAREISLATQQQNAASDEVVLTLKEVSQVVQRMADGLKHFTETADRLNRLGLVIQMLAQSFHLDSPHSLKHTAETWAREVRRRLGNWEAIERLLEDLVHRQAVRRVPLLLRRPARADGAGGQPPDRRRPRGAGARCATGEGFPSAPGTRRRCAEGHTILTPLFNSLLSGQPIFTAATPIYEQGELGRGARPRRQRRQLDQDLTAGAPLDAEFADLIPLFVEEARDRLERLATLRAPAGGRSAGGGRGQARAAHAEGGRPHDADRRPRRALPRRRGGAPRRPPGHDPAADAGGGRADVAGGGGLARRRAAGRRRSWSALLARRG